MNILYILVMVGWNKDGIICKENNFVHRIANKNCFCNLC